VNDAIQLPSKVHFWGRRAEGRKTLPDGTTIVRLSQWGAGRNKNSGPVGRHKRRWYADRYDGRGKK
jgi:hypothetical protein